MVLNPLLKMCNPVLYGISRNLNMITMGEAEGLAKAFLDFVFSAEGQAIVEEESFIAVK